MYVYTYYIYIYMNDSTPYSHEEVLICHFPAKQNKDIYICVNMCIYIYIYIQSWMKIHPAMQRFSISLLSLLKKFQSAKTATTTVLLTFCLRFPPPKKKVASRPNSCPLVGSGILAPWIILTIPSLLENRLPSNGIVASKVLDNIEELLKHRVIVPLDP